MIICRCFEPDDLAPLRYFLANNGWSERVEDIDRFRAMIDGADRTVIAFDNDRVVGFARALCDGASNGYISTVAPDLRREGVGQLKRLHHGTGDLPGTNGQDYIV